MVTAKVISKSKKPVKKSPFKKWMGRLTDLKGAKSDKIIDDLRGK